MMRRGICGGGGARELRATVAALVGAPSIGTGVGDREFDDLVTRLPTPRPCDWDGDQWAGAPSRPWTRTAAQAITGNRSG